MESSKKREIKRIYFKRRGEIENRLKDFKTLLREGSEEDIFAELVFCLLTPQSKAKTCWAAVENLRNKNLLLRGDKNQILSQLKGVRFKYKKAEYILQVRNQFLIGGKLSLKSKIKEFRNTFTAREWLVRNIRGLGYKEASHFLRNIGLGEDIAILDRHILKNLKLLGVIDEIPTSFTQKIYLEIENKMKSFAEKIGIPLSSLDLILWCKETGEIFK